MSNECIVRRVRLELPLELPSPHKEHLETLVYASWLKTHVDEVCALVSENNEKLIVGIRSRGGVSTSAGKTTYVTDFCFANKDAFDYYNSTHLAAMRKRITDSYPAAFDPESPFKYKFGILGTTPADEYAALGVVECDGGDSVETIAAVGMVDFD